MDRELVESKLEALRQFVQRIRDKTPMSAHALSGDADLQDIISVWASSPQSWRFS